MADICDLVCLSWLKEYYSYFVLICSYKHGSCVFVLWVFVHASIDTSVYKCSNCLFTGSWWKFLQTCVVAICGRLTQEYIIHAPEGLWLNSKHLHSACQRVLWQNAVPQIAPGGCAGNVLKRKCCIYSRCTVWMCVWMDVCEGVNRTINYFEWSSRLEKSYINTDHLP